jgi:hypothetical protein
LPALKLVPPVCRKHAGEPEAPGSEDQPARRRPPLIRAWSR